MARTSCKCETGYVYELRKFVLFANTFYSSWVINTDLQELDLDAIKTEVATGDRGKKSHALFGAYEVAAEEHDLKWFKDMLIQHENSERLRREEEIRLEAERKEKEIEKEEKRKAKLTKAAKDGDGDVAMDDADAPKKKADKKRKKSSGDAGDEDQVSSAQTPMYEYYSRVCLITSVIDQGPQEDQSQTQYQGRGRC